AGQCQIWKVCFQRAKGDGLVGRPGQDVLGEFAGCSSRGPHSDTLNNQARGPVTPDLPLLGQEDGERFGVALGHHRDSGFVTSAAYDARWIRAQMSSTRQA